MRHLRAWIVRLCGLFTGGPQDRKFAEEIESHLAMHIEDNLRSGMNPEEARRNAIIKLGGIDKTFETYRDRSRLPFVFDMVRNFRYASRSLIQTPIFTLVVVSTLALGIGANTAIFSAMHQLLLGSLPIENPEELAFVTTSKAPKVGSVWGTDSGGADYLFSYPAFRDLERQQQENLAELAGFRYTNTIVSHQNQAAQCRILMVSGRYFSVVRVRPILGRTILPVDDEGDGSPVVVLGYEFWRDRFGARTDILNQTLRIAGQAFTIVGVTPRGFNGTSKAGMQPDVIIPLAIKSVPSPAVFGAERYDNYWVYLVARVRPGVTFERAASTYAGAYAETVEKRIQTGRYPMGPADVKRLRNSRLSLVDGSRGKGGIPDQAESSIYLMMACTGLVLLIAAVNSASLLLARSVAQRKETAMRVALGASRGRIIGQLLSQAVILAGAAGIAGLAVSSLALRLVNWQLVQGGAPAEYLVQHLHRPVLFYGIILALLTGLMFGLYPALRSARIMPTEALNQETKHATQARTATRIQRTLVCAQIMLSMALLIPTGLLLKTMVNLSRVNLGLQTENLVTFRISPGSTLYRPEWSRSLFERTEKALAAIPGVTAVTASSIALIGGGPGLRNSLTMEGYAEPSNPILKNAISPGFFRHMGIPLLMGREFTERDDLAGQKVAIVNEEFVRKFYPGRNPLGRKFVPGWGPDVVLDTEIVGVVKNSHTLGVREEPMPAYYVPWRQDDGGTMTFYVRSSLPPDQIIPQIRKVARTLDSNIPLEAVRTMDEQVGLNLFMERLIFRLAAAFAVLATALAMMGLYGVTANGVLRRTREFGIRIAIGANPAKIRMMVLREMLPLLAIGLIPGCPAALGLSQLAKSLMFGVTTHDAFVTAGATVAIAVTALAAAYLPARRASLINPLETLRYE